MSRESRMLTPEQAKWAWASIGTAFLAGLLLGAQIPYWISR